MSIVKINLFFKTDCHQNLSIIRFKPTSYRQKIGDEQILKMQNVTEFST